MMPVVRKGDPLHPYGGEVLEGQFNAFGMPVACKGDKVLCNKHGATVISDGASGFSMNGRLLALHGDRCDCGCSLVSTLAVSCIGVVP